MSEIMQIGQRHIGGGAPCFVIAEAGSNHNGSLEQALALIEIAAEVGADAVKFQIFRAKRMYPPNAGISSYLKSSKPIYDIIQSMETPYEWLPKLKNRCDELKIEFMASVFDPQTVSKLDPFLSVFKVASYEMTHLPLLEAIAKTGKPVIVSTGAAKFDEVFEMVDFFKQFGPGKLALMQCTAAYPAPLESLNVGAVAAMKKAFGLPTGLSDHSQDPVIGPVCAAASGADLLEKHFTFSNFLPGPDHRFALEPQELKIMVQMVKNAILAMGSGKKEISEVEFELRHFARRSIFSIRDISRGEIFSEKNIDVLRHGEGKPGLSPSELATVLGRKAANNIPAFSSIKENDIIRE